MIIVKVIGGLGNQMFQFALYKALESRGKEVYLDIHECLKYKRHNGYELQKVFNVNPKIATKQQISSLKNIADTHIVGYKSYYFQKDIFNFDNAYLDGYWQNENYFQSIRSILLNSFKPSKDIRRRNRKVLERLKYQNTVSIHVRRGDYVKKKGAAYIHGGICNLEYYQNALRVIQKHTSDIVLVVFSDDIRWCKRNLNLSDNTVFINWNKRRNSYWDMYIMSKCNHNIIANSSFSWWGAWLNENPNKIVIAPDKWYNYDYFPGGLELPEKWIKIAV